MMTAAVASFAVVPPSRPTMPKIGVLQLDRQPKCGNDIRGHAFGLVAATNREDQQRILCGQPRSTQPFGEGGVPTLIVDAGGQLRDIVGRRIGLDIADLAKVVDRVGRMPGRSAHPDDEQPASPFPQGREPARHVLNPLGVDGIDHGDRFDRETLC